ncbi:YT521-B-like domain-containing protein [Paraphysoderma sedebokerense]|nr:YT521-B-like domain-containing protein [Paraphysoderma sedebokerense]
MMVYLPHTQRNFLPPQSPPQGTHQDMNLDYTQYSESAVEQPSEENLKRDKSSQNMWAEEASLPSPQASSLLNPDPNGFPVPLSSPALIKSKKERPLPLIEVDYFSPTGPDFHSNYFDNLPAGNAGTAPMHDLPSEAPVPRARLPSLLDELRHDSEIVRPTIQSLPSPTPSFTSSHNGLSPNATRLEFPSPQHSDLYVPGHQSLSSPPISPQSIYYKPSNPYLSQPMGSPMNVQPSMAGTPHSSVESPSLIYYLAPPQMQMGEPEMIAMNHAFANMMMTNNQEPANIDDATVRNQRVEMPQLNFGSNQQNVSVASTQNGANNVAMGTPGINQIIQDVRTRSANFNTRPDFARYFVIKCYTEDDVFKSLKYGIWTSTTFGNRRLDKAFRESHIGGPVYLFFSVNGSGQFCAVGEMKSAVDFGRTANIWTQESNGIFNVEFAIVKNVPNAVLRHIKLMNNDGKSVTCSRDTQEITDRQCAWEMLRIFEDFEEESSLLDDLEYFKRRARRNGRSDGLEKKRNGASRQR